MATIKKYTDLQQSKKLAEILPLESADMYYPNRIDIKYQGALPIEYKHGNPLLSQEIPCWSLAALLGVLPDHFYDETGRKTLGMDKGDTYYNIFYENKNSYIQKSADNPVDACYEMILKLHELKML